jgi:hypothetical protein
MISLFLSLSLSHPITSTKLSTVSSQNSSTCWSLQLRRFVMVFEVLNGYLNNLMFFSKSSSTYLFGLSTNPRPAFAASTVQNSRHKFLDAWGKYVCMYYFIGLPGHHLGVDHSLSLSLSLSCCDGFWSSQ